MGILRSDLIAHSQLTSANASVLFDGGDGNAGSTGLKTADSGNKYVIQGDTSELTIECWIYCTSIEQTFDTIWATNNYGVSGNSANFYQHYDGVYFTVAGLASDLDIRGLFELNKWHHVATTRQWSPSKSTHQWRIYVDGEVVGYAETGSNISEGVLCIGANNYGSAFPAFEFAGYISNFRMCKRVLYKEKFTPSKFKLKDVSGTVLLCCQDASDDTAVTVGDTLTAGGSPTPGGFGPDLKEDNTDTGVVLEDNTKFDTLSYMVPPGGTTIERGRDRGVMMGGAEYPTAESNIIEYIRISSGGLTKDFGDLTQARGTAGGASSSTRGVMIAGMSGSTRRNTMDYITIATTGNALDFGDYIEDLSYIGGLSNQTRGVAAGGNGPSSPSSTNQIGYITIATTGNASDFGDLTSASSGTIGSASPTRGLFTLGSTPSFTNTIDYITIATTGNAADYGDMSRTNISSGASCASATRALFAGGYNNTPASGTEVNNIDYVTIASTGNSTDFGDLTIASMYFYGTSNGTRGVFAGRMTTAPTTSDPRIDSVIIASTGNAVDWGYQNRMECGPDESQPIKRRAGQFVSDSHGGIS